MSQYFYVGDRRALFVRGDGTKLVLDLRDVGTLNFVVSDVYERDVTAVISTLLRSGDTFIDVGASLGIHSLAAWRHMERKGHVLAIEANPRSFSLLRQSLLLNGAQSSVTAIHAAAWNEAGTVSFGSEPEQHRVGAVSLDGAINYGEARVTVPAIRIDDLNAEGVSLIKIDVEGREPFVIEGARETIKAFGCALICEYHESVIDSTYGVARFHALLDSLRLKPHRILPDGSFELLESYPTIHHSNLVFKA